MQADQEHDKFKPSVQTVEAADALVELVSANHCYVSPMIVLLCGRLFVPDLMRLPAVPISISSKGKVADL